jgi:hypothetical protein
MVSSVQPGLIQLTFIAAQSARYDWSHHGEQPRPAIRPERCHDVVLQLKLSRLLAQAEDRDLAQQLVRSDTEVQDICLIVMIRDTTSRFVYAA